MNGSADGKSSSSSSSSSSGGGGGTLSSQNQQPKAPRNYKLIADPFLHKGVPKIYRYDGVVPGDPAYPPVVPRDPRNPLARIRSSRLDAMELVLPRFKIDQHYIGEPPAIEITITNLNDNIDKPFLADLLAKCGTYTELYIYYHPTTHKHLGLARIVFENVRSARLCVERLNGTSVMGKVLNVFKDPFGEDCKRLLEEKTSEKKKAPPAAAVAPPPPPPQSAPEPPAPPSRHSSSFSKSESRSSSHYGSRGSHRNEQLNDEDTWDDPAPKKASAPATVVAKGGLADEDMWDAGEFSGSGGNSQDSSYYASKESKYPSKSSSHYDVRSDEDSRGKSDRYYDRGRDNHRRYNHRDDRDRRDRGDDRGGRRSDWDRDRDRDDRRRSGDRYERRGDRARKGGSGGYWEGDSRGYSGEMGYGSGSSGRYGSSYDQYYGYTASSDYGHYGYPPPMPADGYAGSSSWAPPPPPEEKPKPPPPPSSGKSGPSQTALDDCDMWDDGESSKPPPPPKPPSTPPPIPTEQKYDSTVTAGDDDNSGSALDLDTRIALMFKDKTFGAAPFLQLSDGEEEDKREEGEMADDSRDGSIKTEFKPEGVSSPATDADTKVKKETIKVEPPKEEGASDISSSEDDILAKESPPPKPPSKPYMEDIIKRDNDQMSLSSLSSNDGKVEDTGAPPLPPEPAPDAPPPPESIAPYVYPPGIGPGMGYPPAPPGTDPSYYYSQSYSQSSYEQYQSGYYQNSYMQTPYVPGLTGAYPYQTYYSGSGKREAYNEDDRYRSYSSSERSRERSQRKKHNRYEEAITAVIDRVTAELKQILKKDFNKKMIENTAYKKYEAWWDEEEAKSKGKDKISVLSEITPLATAKVDKAPDINQLLNQTYDNLDSNSSYIGLGLRATIPKMPSFRRIRKQPSPVPQDEDSRRSDQEDMVHGSDSEKETDSVSRPKTPPPSGSSADTGRDGGVSRTLSSSSVPRSEKRKPSVSSFFTSSSEEESSASESEDSTDSGSGGLSGVEMSYASKKQQQPPEQSTGSREKRDKRIYSDSDSDEEALEQQSTSKFSLPTSSAGSRNKTKIYSDSDSDAEVSKPPPREVLPPVSTEKARSKSPEPAAATTPVLPLEQLCEALSPDVPDESPPSPQQPPRTPGRESPKKSTYEFDRMYSDSEEEREYQEKRRRKAEYLEQIEREFQEEQLRLAQEREEAAKAAAEASVPEPVAKKSPVKSQAKNNRKNATPSVNLLEKAPSPGDPITPLTSQPPPTPGAGLLDSYKDPMLVAEASASQPASKKKKAEKVSKSKAKGGKKTKETNGVQVPVPELPPVVPVEPLPMVQPLPATTILPPRVVALGGLGTSQLSSSDDFFSADEEAAARRAAKASPASSDGGSSQASQVALDHCYSLPPSASPSSSSPHPQSDSSVQVAAKSANKYAPTSSETLAHDHGYTNNDTVVIGGQETPTPAVPMEVQQQPNEVTQVVPVQRSAGRPKKDPNAPKAKYKRKQDKAAAATAAAAAQLQTFAPEATTPQQALLPFAASQQQLSTFMPLPKYHERDIRSQMAVLYDFLTRGIDAEDIQYIRQSYELLLGDDTNNYWLNATHWVDHCTTDRSFLPPPPKKRKKDKETVWDIKQHSTGSARTQGFYKIDPREKAKYKYHHLRGTAADNPCILVTALAVSMFFR